MSIPVYWNEKDAGSKRGDLVIDLEEDTVGDIRHRVEQQGLAGGKPFTMKRRKYLFLGRMDARKAGDFFLGPEDFIVLSDPAHTD